MAAPVFQAGGTAVTTATADAVVPWPVHATGDVALLWVESSGAGLPVPTVNAGFVQKATSTDSGNTTRLTLYWCEATSGAMGDVTVVGTTCDHKLCKMITVRGAASSAPFHASATADGALTGAGAGGTATAPSVTTTVNDCLIAVGFSRNNDATGAFFSGQTNANLTSFTERQDSGTVSGDGGGFGIETGTLATAGASGASTVTVAAGPTGIAAITVAITAPFSASVSLTGVSGTSAAGTLTATGDATASPTGVQAASAAGTLSATGSATTTLTGVQATASAGTLTASASSDATVTLTGVAATAAAGTLAAIGDALASLLGIEMTASAGVLVAVGDIAPPPPTQTAWRRHTATTARPRVRDVRPIHEPSRRNRRWP